MKIAIYGAGAAGCTLAVPLFKNGQDVTLIARGAHYEAMKNDGLLFTDEHGDHRYHIPVTNNPASLPKQDVVIIATKAYSHVEIAPHIPNLIHDKSLVIPASNGIPWWFLHNTKMHSEKDYLSSVDPENTIPKHIPYDQLAGGLFYMGATYEGAGHVSHYRAPKMIIGDFTGKNQENVNIFGDILTKSGFKRPITDDIRAQILVKLAWNIAFNPLSVISGKTSIEMVECAETRIHAENIMQKFKNIVESTDIKAYIDIEKHIELSRIAGHHKPSMLQDFEAGKPLEIDAIVASVLEIAQITNTPAPLIQTLYNNLRPHIE